MASFARTTILGNLGKDPEVRYAPSGTAVCKFSVAVSEKRKTDDGKWEEQTTWYRVTCFGKTAENAGQFLQKGRQVLVDGRLEVREYTDKEGKARFSVDLTADRVVFVGSKSDGPATPAPVANTPAPGAADGFIDDELPF